MPETKYAPTIGLEIHAELLTNSKMFCACPNDSQEKQPNKNVCPICLGHPGVLPVANEKSILAVMLTGQALHSRLPKKLKFFRKNYFYPDLAKAYQITSQKSPLALGGYLKINGRKIRINHLHLEEDTGRLLHPKNANYSLIDFNRSGLPLMELVTEPNMHSGQQARLFCENLQLILRYLAVANADMEKGEMRCEVNISLSNQKSRIRNQGTERLGTKGEIKNLNSFRAVEQAINFEIKRQSRILAQGQKVIQETRGWDANTKTTFSQRQKEEAHDYRYFPEPDLPAINLANLQKGLKSLPELPAAKQARLIKQYGLTPMLADFLIRQVYQGQAFMADFFEKAISELDDWLKIDKSEKELVLCARGASALGGSDRSHLIQLTANYMATEFKHYVNNQGLGLERLTPENYAEFITFIHQGQVSSSGAQTLLTEMFKSKKDPSDIMAQKDLGQTNDNKILEQFVKQVIAENPAPCKDYQAGQQNAVQFLVGKVMQLSQGKANPQLVRTILERELG